MSENDVNPSINNDPIEKKKKKKKKKKKNEFIDHPS